MHSINQIRRYIYYSNLSSYTFYLVRYFIIGMFFPINFELCTLKVYPSDTISQMIISDNKELHLIQLIIFFINKTKKGFQAYDWSNGNFSWTKDLKLMNQSMLTQNHKRIRGKFNVSNIANLLYWGTNNCNPAWHCIIICKLKDMASMAFM